MLTDNVKNDNFGKESFQNVADSAAGQDIKYEDAPLVHASNHSATFSHEQLVQQEPLVQEKPLILEDLSLAQKTRRGSIFSKIFICLMFMILVRVYA